MNSTHSTAIKQREKVTEFQTTFALPLESAQINKLESRLRLEQEYFNITQEFHRKMIN